MAQTPFRDLEQSIRDLSRQLVGYKYEYSDEDDDATIGSVLKQMRDQHDKMLSGQERLEALLNVIIKLLSKD